MEVCITHSSFRTHCTGIVHSPVLIINDIYSCNSAMYQDGIIWEDGVNVANSLGNDSQKGLWQLSEELLKAKGQDWMKYP